MFLFFLRTLHFIFRPIIMFDNILSDKIGILKKQKELNKRPKLSYRESNRKSINADIIAHACGGCIGLDYTNSLEALIASIELGYHSIEVDVRFTTDGELVCTHDFEDGIVLAYCDFMKRKIDDRFTAMDIRQCVLLAQKSGIDLVIDTKVNSEVSKVVLWLKDHSLIYENIFLQIYQEADIKYVDTYNVLYNIGNEEDYERVTEFCRAYGISQVSMPLLHIKTRKGWTVLLNQGIRVYVHTVNGMAELKKLKELGISGVFSDFLTPSLIRKQE